MDELQEWAWTEGLKPIDAKDEQYEEPYAHFEMFMVLAQIIRMQGWTRDEVVDLLDDCIFSEENTPSALLH